ncbi:unnamed protein product, partial [Rotaria sp. Silwood1]
IDNDGDVVVCFGKTEDIDDTLSSDCFFFFYFGVSVVGLIYLLMLVLMKENQKEHRVGSKVYHFSF